MIWQSALMYTTGPISGGHLSPIITLSVFLRRGNFLRFKNMLGYMAGQALGAIGAVSLMYWLLDGTRTFPAMPAMDPLGAVSASRAFQGTRQHTV